MNITSPLGQVIRDDQGMRLEYVRTFPDPIATVWSAVVDPGELAAVLSSPDAVTVDLEGEVGGTLRVVYSESRDQAVLVGSGLDEVGADRTYQLWTVSGTEPSSAGVFLPGDEGEVESSVTAPGVSPDAWAVTVEPEGGSPAPTGDIIFQGSSA